MTKRRSSLTGSWSGAYRFPGDARPETVFNVQIEEVGGAFTGALQEPNAYGFAPGQVITADIEGVRNGQSVDFTKFYDGSGGMAHAVRYEGTADSDLSRIDGKWSIPRDWSGTFFMVREDDGEAAEAEEAVEEKIEVR
ncbi:MAG: hypothetical protein ACT4OF_02625 [Caulobacteraceae bacterium]